MTFLLGMVIGLLLPPAWRLVLEMREARRGDHLEVRSKERLEMLVRDGAR